MSMQGNQLATKKKYYSSIERRAIKFSKSDFDRNSSLRQEPNSGIVHISENFLTVGETEKIV